MRIRKISYFVVIFPKIVFLIFGKKLKLIESKIRHVVELVKLHHICVFCLQFTTKNVFLRILKDLAFSAKSMFSDVKKLAISKKMTQLDLFLHQKT